MCVCACVCVCVCLPLAILALETTKRYRSDTKNISASSALNGVFPETTALKSYGAEASEKAKGQYVSTGLPRLLLAQFRHCGGIRSYTPWKSSESSVGILPELRRSRRALGHRTVRDPTHQLAVRARTFGVWSMRIQRGEFQLNPL